MGNRKTTRKLKEVLGGDYGGPSIGYQEGKYILYRWYDAPVGSEILVSDKDWQKFLHKVRNYNEKIKIQN